jgi:hypothetical protein
MKTLATLVAVAYFAIASIASAAVPQPPAAPGADKVAVAEQVLVPTKFICPGNGSQVILRDMNVGEEQDPAFMKAYRECIDKLVASGQRCPVVKPFDPKNPEIQEPCTGLKVWIPADLNKPAPPPTPEEACKALGGQLIVIKGSAPKNPDKQCVLTKFPKVP